MPSDGNYPTYILTKVQRGQIGQVLDRANKIREVSSVKLVTGRYDLIARLDTSDPARIEDARSRIRDITGVTAARAFTAHDGFVNGEDVPQGALGFGLLTLHRPKAEVLQRLRSIPEIREAWAVQGNFDILLSFSGRNYADLLRVSTEQLDRTEGITRTETLLAYEPRL